MSTKNQRIEIYKETANIALHDFYLNSYDELVKLRTCDTDNIIVYDVSSGNDPYPAPIRTGEFPTVEVVDNDTLSCAEELVRQDYNVTILNMASCYLPGGGVMKGSTAQEEDIFRRSNLLNYLYPLHPIGLDFGFNVNKGDIKYPIDGEYDAIWTPEVAVFRGTDKHGFPLLREPFYVDVVTCAAVKKPTLTQENHLSAEDAKKMRNKIRTILRASISNIPLDANNALVLGAFGCGAYGNPPDEIAAIFREEIENCNSINYFKKVVFAIIDSNSVGEKHNPNGNFAPFVEEIGKLRFEE